MKQKVRRPCYCKVKPNHAGHPLPQTALVKNGCFMTVCIHALFNIQAFRDVLASVQPIFLELNLRNTGLGVVPWLHRLFQFMNEEVIHTRHMQCALGNFLYKAAELYTVTGFTKGQMGEAAEFYHYLLDHLANLPDHPEAHIVGKRT